MKKTVRVVAIRHGSKEQIDGVGTTSWGVTARLTEKGIKSARYAAEHLSEVLQGCTIFASSPLIRAQEAMFEVMRGLGLKGRDFDQYIHYHIGLWSVMPEIWYLDCDPEQYSNSVVFKLREDDVMLEGRSMVDTIGQIALKAITAGKSTALCVSHSGPLDAGIMVARRSLGQVAEITDLREGEGAIFNFSDGRLVLVESFLHNSVPEGS